MLNIKNRIFGVNKIKMILVYELRRGNKTCSKIKAHYINSFYSYKCKIYTVYIKKRKFN